MRRCTRAIPLAVLLVAFLATPAISQDQDWNQNQTWRNDNQAMQQDRNQTWTDDQAWYNEYADDQYAYEGWYDDDYYDNQYGTDYWYGYDDDYAYGEYDDDAEFEYEPGEGLHEEEWYDPSDWFNDNGNVDYEYDGGSWDYGYYDDYGEGYDDAWGDDYGMGYDTYGYDYGYGDDLGYDYYDLDYYTLDDQQRQQMRRQGQQQGMDRQRMQDQRMQDQQMHGQRMQRMHDQRMAQMQQQRRQDMRQRDQRMQSQQTGMRQIEGEIVGIKKIRAQRGRPEAVVMKVRTEDGQTRNLVLGDVQHVKSQLPAMRKNERVAIFGSEMQRDGRTYFKANRVRSAGGDYDIPQYAYDRKITGELVGVRSVRTGPQGNVKAVVGKVKTQDGRTVDVLLGSPQALQARGQRLQPGKQIQVRGFERNVAGNRMFAVQDVQVRDQQETYYGQQNRRQQQNRQQQDRWQDQQRNQQKDWQY